MKRLYILIAESTVGVHLGKGNEQELCHTVALTFPPTVEIKDGSYHFKSNLSNNNSFKEIIDLFNNENYETEILLGYDDDVTGELMAIACRENLLAQNIPSKKIRRIPLTYDGYVIVREFPKLDKYLKYLEVQSIFSKNLRSLGIKKNVGLSKAFSLQSAVEYAGKTFSFKSNNIINTEKSATIVVVTNTLKKG